MYRIVICDDKKEFAEEIRKKVAIYIKKKEISCTIEVFTDSVALVMKIESNCYFDLYILDVEMPMYSGMELVRMLHEQNVIAKILLLTAYDHYAVDACGLVSGFIPKLTVKQRLEPMLDRVFKELDTLSGKNIYTLMTLKRTYVKIYQENILYIDKDQKYCCIHTTDGQVYRERINLKSLYEYLDHSFMFFADRCVILNIRHIKMISRGKVTLDNSQELLIRYEVSAELKERVSEYWGGCL